MRLNKKQFINFLQCERLSWLNIKNNFSKNQNNVLNYIDENEDSETILDGMQIGELAREFFSNNLNNGNKSINIDYFENEINKISETKKAITKKISVIFEGFFASDKLVVKPDILLYNKSDNSYSLIEVKATSSVKKEHCLDVMFQYFALRKLGIKINNVKIMILNKEYCRSGELDLTKLFIITNLIPQGKKTQKTFFELIQEWEVKNNFDELVDKIIINNTKQFIPKVEMGGHCSGCPFYKNKFCAREIEFLPKHNSIQDLNRMSSKLFGKLLYEKQYKEILEIESSDLSTPLSKKKLQVQQQSIIENKTIVNKPYVIGEIKNYKYPLYMIDFETWKSAIPQFDNTKPYEQQAFQYSLHVILNEDFNWKTMKNIKHYSFLPKNNKDNRYQLAKQMIKDLNRHGQGTLVSYNKSFEIGRILRMAELFPDLKEELIKLEDQFVDLLDFFNKFWIYDQDFHGKTSIKVTLPAFEKQFSYDNLVIQKGTQSSFTFRKFIENKITNQEWKNEYYEDMLKYCNQDTLAMVILWNKIIKLAVY